MICVTGSMGFVGSALRRRLNGQEFIGVDLKGGVDITRNILPRAEVYIHLAADPLVPMSIKQPRETWRNNVDGTLAVLEACRTYGSKIVFASSSQAELDALNPYALQKYQCEQIIKMYKELYGVEYCIFKIYNIFGDGDHGVIGKFIKALHWNAPLTINGGQQRRDFIHVETVIEKLLQGIHMSGTHELGSGQSISIQEIADMLTPNQIHEELPVGEPLELVCPTPTETISVKEYLTLRGLVK